MWSMEEHKFPFDVDADVRREVKLDVEREIIKRDLNEIKRRSVTLLRWFLIVLALNVLASALSGFRSIWSFALTSAFLLFTVLFVNSRRTRGIFWSWRELVSVKKQLRSWDKVAGDYNELNRRHEEPHKN